MKRVRQRQAARIVAAGDAAWLIRFGGRAGPKASQRAMALVAALDAASPPGILDVIPAYASVLVRFDPLVLSPAALQAILRTSLDRAEQTRPPMGRTVRIPVCYGGEYGPDLDDVAHLLGMTTLELIERHSAVTYRVAFLGFLAGYPYLSGLPQSLAVPRLATPRTHVPVGSVAIAERQAGIYPVDSPGGWRILGRTSIPLFDPQRDPPALLRPGDRVRFVPSTSLFVPSVAAELPIETPPRQATSGAPTGIPWLRVLKPGLRTMVQDRGRHGYARYGISASGAADPVALALGNAMLANASDAAALEVTGGDASFEALAPCVIAVTGAPAEVLHNGRAVTRDVSLSLSAGDWLEIGAIATGMRVYLCVAGGVAVPLALGSRATDLRAHLGGVGGRSLRATDVLHRFAREGSIAGRVIPAEAAKNFQGAGRWLLRILPGPHAARSPRTLDALVRTTFMVDVRSDRMGIRLRPQDGASIEGGQLLSEGVPFGAIQVPPDGEPVLLFADAQTTGGYRVPAVVISADLWQVGQLRPGDTVRFRRVLLDEALEALQRHAAQIASIARQPSPETLIGGFAEWSDDADPEMRG